MEKIKAIGKKFGIFAVMMFLAGQGLVAKASSGIQSNLDLAVPDEIQSSGGENALVNMISQLITILLSVLGVLLVLYIIWAGWMWMSSQGDKGKVDKAKDMIKNAVIGLLLIFAAYAIATFVVTNLLDVTKGTA